MAEDPRELAREMLKILEEYRCATDGLMNSLLRADDEGVDAALEKRGECIARYSVEIDRWIVLPSAERDPSLFESIRRHHLCIKSADNDVIQRIESLKSEVGEAIVRIGKAGRMQRSYLPSASARERIVSGEG